MTENKTRALIEALDDMQRKNVQRSEVAYKMPVSAWTPLEWAGALCGETGEAANFAKKIKRDGMSPALKLKLGREIADAISYAALLCESVNLSLGECVVVGFNAVSERVGSDVTL